MPWGVSDLFLVFASFVFLTLVVSGSIYAFLGPNADRPPVGADAETSHAIVQLFRDGNSWEVFLCIVSAVIVAPLVEEFLFRVLLQGWLEKLDRGLGPMMPNYRRLVRWGTGPIVISSIIFAMMHFRVASPPPNTQYLLYMMVGNCLVGILTSLFAVALMQLRYGATAADLGFVLGKAPYDVALGLASAAAVVLPIFIMQLVLTAVLPEWLAADPLPLFCFAVALGTLYCRTHRALPGIVLHMSLNATSLTVFWLYMRS